jgi:LmbE family N-acetylglucosaminyl deacetylase
MKILALGAHPDDLELYCFGALMAWRAMGAEIVPVIATDGAAGGTGDRTALAARREAEARAAAEPLGAEPRFLGLPDGRLMAEPKLAARLASLVAETAPDLIVTHAPDDYHADHRALSAAVGLAAGFAAPVLWTDTRRGLNFQPTHWIDVTAHFPAKMAALRCHESQDPERFVAEATLLAAHRAAECHGGPDDRAEAFRFAPRFPFADIRALLPPAPPVRPIRRRDTPPA